MRNRREFLRAAACAAAIPALPGWASGQAGGGEAADPWTQAARIAAAVRPPQFSRREWDLRRSGARPGQDATAAFAAAIAACARAGGGRVVVPPGEYPTGAIRLRGGVNLHLLAGAVIRFVPDPAKYPLVLTRFEGLELMNFSPLVYAYGQRNIALTGEPGAVLDGGAGPRAWWPWKNRRHHPNQIADRRRLYQLAQAGVPPAQRVFGTGHYLRPQFVQPYRCANVLIQGVTLRHSPMYHLHPVLCQNVTVRGVRCLSAGPNTDGCDPESSREVLIEHCHFSTGDDCIAIKSGRDRDGRRLRTPSRQILIRGCRMARGHGAITIGSEDTGGVFHVYAQDCAMDGAKLWYGLRIKDNARRGGVVEHIHARRLRAGRLARAGVEITYDYGAGPHGSYRPVVREVSLENFEVGAVPQAFDLRGFPRDPISALRFSDCAFRGVTEPNVVENVTGVRLERVSINGHPIRHL
ncbi:MAG: glycoside hydrolase family 28 protein [Terriglobales bacterium]